MVGINRGDCHDRFFLACCPEINRYLVLSGVYLFFVLKNISWKGNLCWDLNYFQFYVEVIVK